MFWIQVIHMVGVLETMVLEIRMSKIGLRIALAPYTPGAVGFQSWLYFIHL
jgi:hypothetical protein